MLYALAGKVSKKYLFTETWPVYITPFIIAAYFLTVVKACFNLTLTQTLVRLTSSCMSKKQREHLQSTSTQSTNFAGYLCQVYFQKDNYFVAQIIGPHPI